MRTSLAIFILFVATFGETPVFSQTEDLPITTSAAARFEFAEQACNVFPMASNLKVKPELWQFRYFPFFAPEVDQNGKLVIITQQEADSTWSNSMVIRMDFPEARRRAVEQIRRAFPDEATRINDLSCGRILIYNLKAEVRVPNGRYITEPHNLGGSDVYKLTIPANSQPEAQMIERYLRGAFGQVRWSYQYDTRKITENFSSVTMTLIRNTGVLSSLDGMRKDPGKVYVSRDALRNMVDGIKSRFTNVDWVEDPATFDKDVAAGLLRLWPTQVAVELSNFEQRTLQPIYNPNDLTPARVDKFINDSVEKGSGHDSFKLKVAAQTGGSFGYGPISAAGHLNGEYDKDQVNDYFREHGIRTEWDGKQFVAKELLLHEVNTADLSSDKMISSRKLFVGSKDSDPGGVDFQFSTMTPSNSMNLDLHARMEALQLAMTKLSEQNKLMLTNQTEHIKLLLNKSEIKTASPEWVFGVGIDQGIPLKVQLKDWVPPMQWGRKVIGVILVPAEGTDHIADLGQLYANAHGENQIEINITPIPGRKGLIRIRAVVFYYD